MKELLQKLVSRISPRNGMAVNARLWTEAHDYHRFHQQAHFLLSHGPGVVTGLEVYAEANSRRVWIRPGLAVDPQGQLIILDEQDSEVIGPDQAGLIYLFLEGAGESRLNGPDDSPTGPDRVRDGYVIESAATLPPSAVEVARLRLTEPEATIKNAADRRLPGPNELDLRFRRRVGAAPQVTAGLAIHYRGQPETGPSIKYGARAGHLAQTLSRLTAYRVCIDDDVSLTAALQPYTLLYLIEQGPHDLSWPEIEALKRYLQEDSGTLFIESYQPERESSLLELLDSFEVELASVPPDHALLAEPFIFSAPPPGFEPGAVRLGDGVIFSSCDYSRLWQGGRSNGHLSSREAIRAALEWGGNLATYAVKRRNGRQEAIYPRDHPEIETYLKQ